MNFLTNRQQIEAIANDGLPQLLRAMASGSEAQINKHDIILNAAADEIEKLRIESHALRGFTEFAWTTITGFDCDEARQGLQKRIDAARAAIKAVGNREIAATAETSA